MSLAINPFLEADAEQTGLWFRQDHGDGTSSWVVVNSAGTTRFRGKHYPVTRVCGHVEVQWLPFLESYFGQTCFELERLEKCIKCNPSRDSDQALGILSLGGLLQEGKD